MSKAVSTASFPWARQLNRRNGFRRNHFAYQLAQALHVCNSRPRAHWSRDLCQQNLRKAVFRLERGCSVGAGNRFHFVHVHLHVCLHPLKCELPSQTHGNRHHRGLFKLGIDQFFDSRGRLDRILCTKKRRSPSSTTPKRGGGESSFDPTPKKYFLKKDLLFNKLVAS